MAILRDAIPAVELPEEVVDVPVLGGEVIVRGMDLPQMLAFNAARRRSSQPRGEESEADAAERAGGDLVPLALSMCVLAEDRQPVYSAAQWAVWCTRHISEALALSDVVSRLSGTGAQAEKKA